MQQDSRFLVRFWGVRGSLPSGSRDTVRYGGNTMCVEARCGDKVIVFDAGSGMRWLGERLLQDKVGEVDVFLSHFHYDHVCGLPFFTPLFRKEARITFWSAGNGGERHTRELIDELMRPPFFPVGPEVFCASVGYSDLCVGTDIELSPDIRLRTFALAHPGGATGYRLEYAGKALCYLCDMEHRPQKHDPALIDFVKDADAVLYDATYTDEEYPEFCGFGHSTWQKGAQLCEEARAKKLLLCHHRPRRSDEALAAIELAAQHVFPQCYAARDDMEFDL